MEQIAPLSRGGGPKIHLQGNNVHPRAYNGPNREGVHPAIDGMATNAHREGNIIWRRRDRQSFINADSTDVRYIRLSFSARKS